MTNVYVTVEEFVKFKNMTLQKFAQTEERVNDLAEIIISGFERLDAKIDKKFDELENKMDIGFGVTDRKFEDLTEIMIDGFDAMYEKYEEVR
jgi:hypothetical protein